MNICVSPYGNMNWCVLSVFILGLWAAGRLMLWLVVLSISQWFFVLYSIKNPRLSTTCLHNRYFKVTSFYSSSCSISWNNPPWKLAWTCPKTGFARWSSSQIIDLLWFPSQPSRMYPLVSPACRINQTTPDNPMIFSAARFAARIRLLRSSSWWTFSLCLARGC
jgi:hypothetical protein